MAKVKKTARSKQNNSTIFVLMLVMLVNALAYGTIIPLLYPYASKFGIDPLGLSFLFASFSLAQLISTPFLGRLSDKYGRKPILLLCLLGTGISLALFASATNVWMLFIARILDGVTGGNNSVAQAMVADTTEGHERAKAFGMLGAAFGFGFLFGPAIGGLLSQYGMTLPFWFAAGLALVGTLLGQLILKETLPPAAARVSHKEPLFRWQNLVLALFAPATGLILALSLVTSIGLNAFIIGFQSYTVDILKMSTRDVGLLFAMLGIVTIIMQAGGIKILLKLFKSKKLLLSVALIVSSLALIGVADTHTVMTFAVVLLFHMIASAPHNPLLMGLLSERSRAEDQGGILGINQAYLSLGQIVGPLIAGMVAGQSVSLIFVLAGAVYGFGALASVGLYMPVRKKADL